ncbi:MAG TPA: helix-turn-helix domain-containing protein [Chitinophagaceae bacterium]|nr:helix-turn-helix domain-containing protein [Chitinophagaceae bacterium]
MTVNLITKEELQLFKKELLAELTAVVNAKEAPTPKWLKSYQVRELLGISRGTLQSLRERGTIKATLVGGLMFYEYDEIVKLLRGGRK